LVHQGVQLSLKSVSALLQGQHVRSLGMLFLLLDNGSQAGFKALTYRA